MSTTWGRYSDSRTTRFVAPSQCHTAAPRSEYDAIPQHAAVIAFETRLEGHAKSAGDPAKRI
jgi:hypothetical protein